MIPVQFHPDASFSSEQELPEPQDCPLNEGPSVNTTSPEDSQTAAPIRSDPIVSGSSGSASLPVQLDTVKPRPGPETPEGLEQVSVDTDHLCGWGTLKPKAIQVFNTPRWMLFFLCLAFFLHGSVNDGSINAVVTSIERRFNLNSYEAGLIVSTYDITMCMCLAFVSYFGGKGHKPRWLAWGMFSMGLGSSLFALPHFTTSSYKANIPYEAGLCMSNQTIMGKGKEGEELSNYRFVFMLAQVLHGICGTSLYTLAITYMDENVKSEYTPVYNGIYHTAGVVGPALGYLLSGYFLNIYIEIHQPTDMTPNSPHWVGAWWITFPMAGAGALLLTIPIMAYPKQLPGSREFAPKRVPEAPELNDRSKTTASGTQFANSVIDMLRSVLILLKNASYLFLCLASAAETLIFVGISTFGPKFLELQFSLSASNAVTYFAYMVVPAGGSGTFLGSYIVKRWNMSHVAITRFCVLCATVSLATMFVFLIYCPEVSIAGVNTPYQYNLTASKQLDLNENMTNETSFGQETPLVKQNPERRRASHVRRLSLQQSLTVGCNSHCHCKTELYNPVCGADGITYYSPCYAGCTSINDTKHSSSEKMYSGCSCVLDNMSWGNKGLAVAGKCANFCPHLLAFLSLLFILFFFTALSAIPALMATLRCVPENQKSFALGIQWIIVFLLGNCQGPVTFGSMIDLSCLLWEDEVNKGSCYLYDNKSMSLYILVVGVTTKVLGTVFFLVAGIMYKPPPEDQNNSWVSTDPGTGVLSDLSEDDIVNMHAGPDARNEPQLLTVES